MWMSTGQKMLVRFFVIGSQVDVYMTVTVCPPVSENFTGGCLQDSNCWSASK